VRQKDRTLEGLLRVRPKGGKKGRGAEFRPDIVAFEGRGGKDRGSLSREDEKEEARNDRECVGTKEKKKKGRGKKGRITFLNSNKIKGGREGNEIL